MSADAPYISAPSRRVTQSKIAKGIAQARPELGGFARTLLEAMLRKRMSASSVARAVWGTHVNKQGFTVAKNRDRIGQYLAGASYPKPETLALLAKVLDLEPEALRVDNLPGAGPTARAQAMAPVEFNLTVMAGYSRHALFQVNKLLPIDLCMKLVELMQAYLGVDPPIEITTPNPATEQAAKQAAQTVIEDAAPEDLGALSDELQARRAATRKTSRRVVREEKMGA